MRRILYQQRNGKEAVNSGIKVKENNRKKEKTEKIT